MIKNMVNPAPQATQQEGRLGNLRLGVLMHQACTADFWLPLKTYRERETSGIGSGGRGGHTAQLNTLRKEHLWNGFGKWAEPGDKYVGSEQEDSERDSRQ